MRLATMLILATLTGCAATRLPPLTVAASHVERITSEEGLSCSYLRNIDYVAKLNGVGKSYELGHQAGENGVRDEVAGIGGNAFITTRMDADTMWGKIHYSAQAFQCPDKILAGFNLAGRPGH